MAMNLEKLIKKAEEGDLEAQFRVLKIHFTIRYWQKGSEKQKEDLQRKFGKALAAAQTLPREFYDQMLSRRFLG